MLGHGRWLEASVVSVVSWRLRRHLQQLIRRGSKPERVRRVAKAGASSRNPQPIRGGSHEESGHQRPTRWGLPGLIVPEFDPSLSVADQDPAVGEC